jgi:tRNA pseudouridine65 synthase
LARHPTAAKKLADEFQLRSVKKLYIGVLRGQLMLNAGTWAHPLTDKSEGRRNPAGIAKDRVPCETRFQIIKSSPHFTLCEFDLITGRQHQIRKHAALARHALVGDPRYGDRDYNEKISERYSESRLCLHCLKITILGQVIESATPVSFEKMF